MLIMTSIIRVGQSKVVAIPIDEDSSERIMNCIQMLSELEEHPAVQEIFLGGTRAAFSRMLGAQEVCILCNIFSLSDVQYSREQQKRAAEKKALEAAKPVAVQVDDLLMFRQFSKKAADEVPDVSWHPFLSNVSKTGDFFSLSV